MGRSLIKITNSKGPSIDIDPWGRVEMEHDSEATPPASSSYVPFTLLKSVILKSLFNNIWWFTVSKDLLESKNKETT